LKKLIKLHFSFNYDYEKINKKLMLIISFYDDMEADCDEGITDEDINNKCTQILNEIGMLDLGSIQRIKYEGLDFIYEYNEINEKYLNFLNELLEEWKNKKCDTSFIETIKSEISMCNKRHKKIEELIKKLDKIEKIIKYIKLIETSCIAKTVCNYRGKCEIRT